MNIFNLKKMVIIISLFSIKHEVLAHIKGNVSRRYVIKDNYKNIMNRFYLNAVCPKLISNWQVFRKVEVRIFEVLL